MFNPSVCVPSAFAGSVATRIRYSVVVLVPTRHLHISFSKSPCLDVTWPVCTMIRPLIWSQNCCYLLFVWHLGLFDLPRCYPAWYCSVHGPTGSLVLLEEAFDALCKPINILIFPRHYCGQIYLQIGELDAIVCKKPLPHVPHTALCLALVRQGEG